MKSSERGDQMRITWSCVIIGAAVALATGAVGASASGERAEAGQGYKVVGKWGKDGTANGQFRNPSGIDTDRAGNVYVADSDNHRVQVFSAKGAFLRKWGSVGGGNGQFLIAEDVEIAPNGTVWVADQQNSRLQGFSSTGSFEASIGQPPDELPRAVGVAADGSVLAAANGGERSGFRRWVEKPTGWEAVGGLMGAGEYRVDEVEGSPDGTIYLVTSASQVPYNPRVRHYTPDGKALGSFKRGDTTPGIGVDLDCNIWSPDIANRRIVKYSPSGKVLATASVPDLIAADIAVGPTGDLYVIHQSHGIVHFAENHAKPATANVPGRIAVSHGKATIRYGATGFACPAQVAAVVTLSGKGVSGHAAVKVAAGKFTPIAMAVKGPAGKTVPATFTIVLKTNGRATTEKKAVQVSFSK
jgi:sugar lactone lactonase YvrE